MIPRYLLVGLAEDINRRSDHLILLLVQCSASTCPVFLLSQFSVTVCPSCSCKTSSMQHLRMLATCGMSPFQVLGMLVTEESTSHRKKVYSHDLVCMFSITTRILVPVYRH